MSLWDTTDKDMEWGDYVVPVFRGDLKVVFGEAEGGSE